MDSGDGNPARRIEVIFSEVDRKVAVDLPAGHPDEAAAAVVDHVVSALETDDSDEAERELTSGIGALGRVRRVR